MSTATPPIATTLAGQTAPLGATVTSGGVNFSVFSKHASAVELLLFDDAGAATPSMVVPLDARQHKTYHYWHVSVPGVGPGQLYGFRAHGPFAPERGLRFDRHKVLLDPYGLAVAVPAGYDRRAAMRPGDNAATAMKSVVADPSAYDWEGDSPPRRSAAETIIYELHVRGFTQHHSAGLVGSAPGTFAALIEKIPYLLELGITAVELLPVFQFDPQDSPTGVNYWGYQPISFFAPHHAYSSRADPLGALDDFRDMVKAFHRAGLEVILDVVYNHTTEGDADGPTLCYRGLANEVYYVLDNDRSRYADYTGCGNTLKANNPIVRRLIQDSLRYWVREMHVDGFRFDLASVLSRDETGHPMPNPPILWDIESDPLLAGTKLIAEAWDAAGLYQVGRFVGDAWQEWNGRARDDFRRFFRGDADSVSAFATRLLGSPDMYSYKLREAEHSVNFVTCHDGFTLNDLVSYDRKHNEANGSNNQDGTNDNLSWNCGAEGPTDDPAIETLRNRQVKNLLALTILAAGTPMLLMGDEVRRTQRGNNNAYCHDNDMTWFDWTLLERHADVRRFVSMVIAFRQRRDTVLDEEAMTLNELLHRAHVDWHGVRLHHPDWSHDSHSIACTITSVRASHRFHAMINAFWEPLTFELPAADGHGGPWSRLIDTALAPPDDACVFECAPAISAGTYVVQPRSLALLTVSLNASPSRVVDRR